MEILHAGPTWQGDDPALSTMLATYAEARNRVFHTESPQGEAVAMDNSILPALTGIFGSLLGGSASVVTAWVTQRTSNRRKELHANLTRREELYGKFINECSARALDSVENTLDRSERLLPIYSLVNRIRLCASDRVLAEAEAALATITEQYFQPSLSLEQVRALIRDGAKTDPLKSFAEACRGELKSLHTAL